MRNAIVTSLMLAISTAAFAQLPASDSAPAGQPQLAQESADGNSALPALDPGEPFGLALRGGIDVYSFSKVPQEIRKARIEWGMEQSAVSTLLKPPAGDGVGFERDKGLSCMGKKNGVDTCFTNVAAPWNADFGGDFRWSMQPFLRFADGAFYGYSLHFNGDGFEDTKQSLIARLGKPKAAEKSTVENRMGAKFDQETIIWETKHTRVLLLQRQPSDLTKGLLDVTYTPLEKSIKPEAPADAPF